MMFGICQWDRQNLYETVFTFPKNRFYSSGRHFWFYKEERVLEGYDWRRTSDNLDMARFPI